MAEALRAPNLNFGKETPTKKPIFLIIIALMITGVGILFTFSSFQQAAQDYKMIFAETPPTENSELIYPNSSGVNLEPFSGKTVKAYKVPYNSEEINNFYIQGFIGILITTVALSILAYKYGELRKVKSQNELK